MQKVVIEVRVKQFWSEIVHFTVACLVAKPLNRSEAKGDLVMIQTSLFSNANYFVIMLIGYWSLSQQGHLQHVFSDQIALHSVQLPLLMSQNKKYCK